MPFTGTLPTPADGNIIPGADIALLANALHGLTDSWTPFVTTWASTGTTPSIGNGLITSRYIQSGKLVVFRGQIQWGSTTAGGTGSWTITLPVAALDGALTGGGFIFDSSAGAGRQPAGVTPSGSVLTFYGGGGGIVTVTTPITWAVSDALTWCILYEVA